MADIYFPVQFGNVVKKLRDMGGYWAEEVYNLNGGGGGSGTGTGGAVTIADGDAITIGSTSAAAYTGTGSANLVSLLKGIYAQLAGTLATSVSNVVHVIVDNSPNVTATISGTPTVNANVTNVSLPVTATITGTPAVTATITGTPNVSVTNTPAVTISGTVATTSTITGTPAVTIAAGADVTEGNITDTAYAGSGNSTVISALKGIYSKLAGTLATNVGNFPAVQPVSSTDGALVSIGAVGDLAYTGTGTAGVVALLKGIYAKLAGTLTTTTSVSNFPTSQAVTSADGALAAIGSTTDLPSNSYLFADPALGNGSVIAQLKALISQIDYLFSGSRTGTLPTARVSIMNTASNNYLTTTSSAGLVMNMAPIHLMTSSYECKLIVITADNTNTGAVFISDSNTSTQGVPVYPGQTREFPINNGNKLWYYSNVNGQKMYAAVFS